MKEFIIRNIELTSRRIYYGIPLLQKKIKRNVGVKKKTINLQQLKTEFVKNKLNNYDAIMVHSRLTGLNIEAGDKVVTNQLLIANSVLKLLFSLAGSNQSILMPTHPLYKEDPGFMNDKSSLILSYSRLKTPSKVGMLTEIFRRTKGVRRSSHPLSSVAIWGKLADFFLEKNFNKNKPLPHGIDSPYYRLGSVNSAIVAINIPLVHSMSLIHTPEECKDQHWPIEGFFYDRTFIDEETGKKMIVRERKPEWVKYISLKQVEMDLKKNGILQSFYAGEVKIEFANAQNVLKLMSLKNKNSTYPYYYIPQKFYKKNAVH